MATEQKFLGVIPTHTDTHTHITYTDPEISEGGLYGGVQPSRFVVLRFPLFWSVFGVARYPDAGKNSTKNVIVTPLFVSPPNARRN